MARIDSPQQQGAARRPSRLDAVFDASSDFIATADSEGRTLFLNRSARALLGLSPVADIRDIPVSNWIADSFVGRLIRDILPCAERDGSWSGDMLLLKADGVEVPASMVVLPHPEPTEEDAAFTLIGRDRSVETARRKAAEAALHQSEASFRNLFDSITESVSIQHRDGTVLDVNPAFLSMYGYRRDEIVGKQPEMLADRERVDLRETRACFSQALAGLPQRFESWGRRRSGEAFPQEIVLTRGTYMGEEVVISVAREVSARKNLEMQLRQSQKMEAVGRLAGGVAHDFNNLLTVIHGSAEILLADVEKENGSAEEVTEIMKASARAAELTHQLLAFSRQQVLLPKLLDLNSVIPEMETMLRRVLGETVTLDMTLDPELGHTLADPGQVQQVLLNLVINAKDAMPSGGRLSLTTSALELDPPSLLRSELPTYVVPGSYVCLEVTDTGTGMDRATMNRLFEPFFTTKEAGKGTGLGLSTVYGIIKQSQGFVWARSEVGIGSTFTVLLPRVEDAAAPVLVPNPSVPVPASGSGIETILLVEDEEALRKVLRRVLERAGYSVLEAPDGEAAYRVCAQYRDTIHLVVTDIVMPGATGPEVAGGVELLRPEAKVVYMSGYADDALSEHGVSPSEIHFLQKPFTSEAFLAMVREVLAS